jgi:hypothetical protein
MRAVRPAARRAAETSRYGPAHTMIAPRVSRHASPVTHHPSAITRQPSPATRRTIQPLRTKASEARYVLPMGWTLMQAASSTTAGIATNRNVKRDAGRDRPCRMGFARAAVANRESASVSHDCGAERRFFIGVQFWRVTGARVGAQAMFYNRGLVCNSAHEIESDHEQHYRSRADRRQSTE